MFTLLTFVHVLVALVLILVVLLQSSRGTDIAGAFGGMGSQTAFGPRGTSNFLSRTTAVLAAIFMVTALTLSLLSNRGRRSGSVLSGEKPGPTAPQTAPPAPGLPPGITPGAPPVPGTQPAPGPPTMKITPVQPPAPQSQVPQAQPPAQTAPATTSPSGGSAPAPPAGR